MTNLGNFEALLKKSAKFEEGSSGPSILLPRAEFVHQMHSSFERFRRLAVEYFTNVFKKADSSISLGHLVFATSTGSGVCPYSLRCGQEPQDLSWTP